MKILDSYTPIYEGMTAIYIVQHVEKDKDDTQMAMGNAGKSSNASNPRTPEGSD
jgi:hypothetical protein